MLFDKSLKEEEIIKKMEQGDERVLEYLYKKHYRMIARLVVSNNGSEEEAKDIFQDGLIVFWQKVTSKQLILTSKISTYLYSVCQNLWHKELTKKNRLVHEEKEEIDPQDPDQKEKIAIIQKCIDQLGDSCKQILTYYYFEELSMEAIAEKMELANADVAKTKKYKCKKELDELVKSIYSVQDALD